MESEEAVQCCVAHHVIATDQQSQVRANKRNRGKQVHDHLRTPVAHLAPRQQIAHESLGHQTQENGATKNPDQFTRLTVAAVNQPAEHVHVNHDEERRGTCGVHVPDQPTPWHIPHDVFHRAKSQSGVWFVVHNQKDAGNDLDGKNQNRQRTEDVKEVEVLGGVVLTQVVVVQLAQGKAVVDPVQQARACRGVRGYLFHFSHDLLRRLKQFCLRRSAICCRRGTCGVGFPGCPVPACS